MNRFLLIIMSWTYSTETRVMTEFVSVKDIFRKVWNINCVYDLNEHDICILLKKNPHKHIVHIYDVQRGHVDEEMLDVTFQYTATEFIKADGFNQIISALKHLHTLGIIYVDLKLENIGWSTQDSCYKLFDFNASGIIENNGQLRRELLPGFMYQEIIKSVSNPIFYDLYAYTIFCNKIESEANQ